MEETKTISVWTYECSFAISFHTYELLGVVAAKKKMLRHELVAIAIAEVVDKSSETDLRNALEQYLQKEIV